MQIELAARLGAPIDTPRLMLEPMGGLATEAVRAASVALNERGVRRLVATVTVGNAASARVLLKAGFRFTRVLSGSEVIRGVAVDDEEYVRTAQ